MKPTEIISHRQSRVLEIAFENGERFKLPWEYLRVFSPSAEVRGRLGEKRLLVTGKADVVLGEIKPIGNYALKLYFDDGHNSGLFDWSYLYELGVHQPRNWQQYLEQMQKAGSSRTK